MYWGNSTVCKGTIKQVTKGSTEQLCLTYCIGVYSKRTLYTPFFSEYQFLQVTRLMTAQIPVTLGVTPITHVIAFLVRISTKYYCLSTLVGFLDLSDFAGYREVGNLV